MACFPAANTELIAAAWLMAQIPFKEGDRVHCTSAGIYGDGGIYDGIGHVVEISTDPKNLASLIVPMYRVEMEEKAYPEQPDEMWYAECGLEKVEADA